MEALPQNTTPASNETASVPIITLAAAKSIMRKYRRMKDEQREWRRHLEYYELLAYRQKIVGDQLRSTEAIKPGRGFRSPNDLVDEIIETYRVGLKKLSSIFSGDANAGDEEEVAHGTVRIRGDRYETYCTIWGGHWEDHQEQYERINSHSADKFAAWCVLEEKAKEAEPIAKAAEVAKAEAHRLELKRGRDEVKALLQAREAKRVRRAKA